MHNSLFANPGLYAEYKSTFKMGGFAQFSKDIQKIENLRVTTFWAFINGTQKKLITGFIFYYSLY